MKLPELRLIDQALSAEEPCLGAVFCTYTFDPAYFEDHVLRSVLRLRCDPEEDATRYHEEALRALQETPVACIVDASVRTPGRRFPYDLALVRKRTFHPKVFVLLFESEARLAVGSGNVTKSGLEQNTEMFFVRRLPYGDPASAGLLREVDAFLAECEPLATHPGSQLALVRQSLANRIGPAPSTRQRTDVQFVSSFGGPLLEQLSRALPNEAKITRVGVLAPFFEQDDLEAGAAEEGMHAVLADLLRLRPSDGAVLDLGVPWDDAPLAAPASEAKPSLDDGIGALWAWRKREPTDDGHVERMDYLVVEAATAKRAQAKNAAGDSCRFERELLEAEIDAARLWRVPTPTVFAPKNILRRLASERAVRLWLHPTSDVAPSGRARRRPLHAKVFLVTTTVRNRTFTYAMIGSANASRSALAKSVEQRGNVEAGVLRRFDGEVTLRDVLPTLVSHSLEGVELCERETPEASVDLSAWIDDVVHDAAARTLQVVWRTDGPAPLENWTLRYLDRDLASGNGAPASPTEIASFDLATTSAEVILASAGMEWQLPIRVLDLAALPTESIPSSLGLRELLALLGRRVGSERLAAVRAQRGPVGVASVLDAVFGEGFGPTDVFKAWWGAAEDLRLAATIAAFRHRLVGPTGVRTAWRQLREVPPEVLSPDEIWVYGCELLRELKTLDLNDGPDTPTKRALLDEVVTELNADLLRLVPTMAEHPWMAAVAKFYGVRDARA